MSQETELTKEDDLILETGEEETEEVPDFDLHAEINSACVAYNTLSEIDLTLQDKATAKLVKDTRKKCLEIIYKNISEVHAMACPEE